MPTLECYIDFKAPAAYLALQPTLELQQQLNLTLLWHPYQTRQSAIPAPLAQETPAQSHIRVRAEARQRVHLKYAALRGIGMHFPTQPGNCDLALAAMYVATNNPALYCRLAFEAYWVHQQDLSELTLIENLLRTSGHDPQTFNAGDRLAQLYAAQTPTEERGVVDAPAYIFADQVFIGREHLPWLRELLSSG